VGWSAEALAIADDALASVAGEDLPMLASACRHVAAGALHDALADALPTIPLARVCDALEGFATPRLARALLARLHELDARQLPFVLPLCAHVLGEEAAAPLLAFARTAPLTPRLEAIAG